MTNLTILCPDAFAIILSFLPIDHFTVVQLLHKDLHQTLNNAESIFRMYYHRFVQEEIAELQAQPQSRKRMKRAAQLKQLLLHHQKKEVQRRKLINYKQACIHQMVNHKFSTSFERMFLTKKDCCLEAAAQLLLSHKQFIVGENQARILLKIINRLQRSYDRDSGTLDGLLSRFIPYMCELSALYPSKLKHCLGNALPLALLCNNNAVCAQLLQQMEQLNGMRPSVDFSVHTIGSPTMYWFLSKNNYITLSQMSVEHWAQYGDFFQSASIFLDVLKQMRIEATTQLIANVVLNQRVTLELFVNLLNRMPRSHSVRNRVKLDYNMALLHVVISSYTWGRISEELCVNMMRECIKRGADVNAKIFQVNNTTPSNICVFSVTKFTVPILQVLVENGLDVNNAESNRSYTLLAKLIRDQASTDCIKYMVQMHSNVNHYTSGDGNIADLILFWLPYSPTRWFEVLEFVLKYGAKVNGNDSQVKYFLKTAQQATKAQFHGLMEKYPEQYSPSICIIV